MIKKYILLISILVFSVTPNGFSSKSNSYTGKISNIGSAPFVKLILVTPTQLKYSITGNTEILEELKNLQGATVLLEGIETSDKTIYGFPEIKAETYRLLFIGEGENRRTPWVGILMKKKGQLYLKTFDKMYLLTGSIVTLLEPNLQAKIWVTGTLKRNWFWKPATINIDAYQIIRK